MNSSSYDYDASLNSNWLTTMSPSWKNGEVDIDTDSGEDEENPLVNSGKFLFFYLLIMANKHYLAKVFALVTYI